MLFNEPLYPLDLGPSESAAALKPNRVEPELRDVVVTLHMDVGWFLAIPSIEEEPIWAKPQHRWHVAKVPERGRL